MLAGIVFQTSVLNANDHIISKLLSLLINRSFETGIYFDSLKYTIVKTLFKKAHSKRIKNYRPISVFRKIF